jgi:hypothetical protein
MCSKASARPQLAQASSRVRLGRGGSPPPSSRSGDAVRAAELYDRMGARSDAAKTRLRAAELLFAQGGARKRRVSSSWRWASSAGGRGPLRRGCESLLACR